MKNVVIDVLRKQLLGAGYDIKSCNNISLEIRDGTGYKYYITCVPKGREPSFTSQDELDSEALAYTE